MSYSETLSHSIVTLDLGPDGHCRAANIQRHFHVTFDDQPRPEVVTRDVITASDLAAILPDRATLLLADAARAAAEAERDAKTAEAARLAARVAELEAARSQVDAAGFPVLSAVQIRLGLIATGIALETVDAAISTVTDPVERARARSWWEYSTEYRRDHALLAAVGAALGLSPAAIDSMWRAAAGL